MKSERKAYVLRRAASISLLAATFFAVGPVSAARNSASAPGPAPVNLNQVLDCGLLWKTLAGVTAVALGLALWNRRLAREIRRRQGVEKALGEGRERMGRSLIAANAGAGQWNMRTNEAIWSDESYLVLGLKAGSVESNHSNWSGAVHPEDRDEAGEIQIDITDEKLAARAINGNERIYREIFNGTKDAIFIHDPQTGGVADVNQGMLDMFGYSREEVARLTLDDLSLGSAPYDQRHAEERIRQANAIGAQTFEWLSRKKGGELFWSEVVLKSMAIGGRHRVLAVVRDIDERKRAQEALRQKEEYYRSLFENAMDIIAIMDRDGTILFESPSVKRILGYSPEGLTGRNAFALVHPQDAEPSRSTFERLVRNPGAIEQTEFRFRHRDGSWRVLQAVGSNLLEVPAVGAIVVNLRDVTERREAEQQLRVSLQEKEILLREVHHRVKNNLQIILSLLNLQSESVKSPEVLDVFKESRQRVKTIAMVHESLYGMSDLSRIVLSHYIEGLVKGIVSANCREGSVAVHLDVPEIPLSVNTAVPFGLILNELVMNCLKHAFSEARKGSLKICVHPAGENRLTLMVEDDGPGLPEYFDVGKARSLGFTLIRALVKQLKGTIEIKQGAGARFSINFLNRF